MVNIKNVFKSGAVFIAYITAGQRNINCLLESALALIKGGVNILEIGVPFSDPVADGPVIQRAMVDALENNTKIEDALTLTAKIKQQVEIPVVLFSYYNPILQQSKQGFYERAKAVGIDGILVVDLPHEEAADHIKNCKENEIDPIFIIAPSTTDERIKEITKDAKGFIYYVCRKGTTGMKNTLPDNFANKIAKIKKLSNLPVVAGFGIASRKNASEVIKQADGFVVGSRFVHAIEQGITDQELKKLTKEIDPRKGRLS